LIQSMCCNSNETILDALKIIDLNAKGILFVVDNDGVFKGTLTDGDLRRAFISKISISTKLHALLENKKSVSMPAGTPVDQLLKSISDVIKIIPLLNAENRVVDFFEFKAGFHAPIAATELTGNEMVYVMECISTNWISSQGRFVTQFEENFSGYNGTRFGVAVSNGTVALHLALVALGIGPGDEVIVPDLTFVGTINAVLYTGATPVLADVCETSWCIDPDSIKRVITTRTKAIIPVHLYGQPCDMDRIIELSREFGLFVIEDCAEAHGAEYKGRKVGSFGDINCFSFFGNKIITMGEGGICLTNNEKLAEKMKILRDHGMSKSIRYWHDTIGYNYRLTNLQAAIGVAQLERIDEILLKRDQIKKWYLDYLQECEELQMQVDLPANRSVNWLFSCQINTKNVNRESLITRAKNKGVDIRPFFYPLHSMPIYQKFMGAEQLSVSEKLSMAGISLPTVLSLSKEEYRTIARIIMELVHDK
jgi:perosamine synthetase